MKVKLGISTPPVQTSIPVDMVALSAEIADLKDKICAVTGEISELSQVVDNLQLVRHAVAESEKPIDALTTLDTVASVESLLGVAADKITKSVAMEGLGSAIVDTFKKLIEAIKKFFSWVASFFTKSSTKTSAATDKAVAETEQVAEILEKEVEKFKAVKNDSAKVQEMKSNPPEKPSIPDPPPASTSEGSSAPKNTDSSTLLLTYDPDPSNRVFKAADLNEWITHLDKLLTMQEKLLEFGERVMKEIHLNNNDVIPTSLVNEITELSKKCFGDGLKVGTGDNGVLVGVIAINDSNKLFPAAKNGTVVTLHWTQAGFSKLGQHFVRLKNTAERHANSNKLWTDTLAKDLKKYESLGADETTEQVQAKIRTIKKEQSCASIICRMTGSFTTFIQRSCAFYGYDCKVVKAAMSW